MHCKGGCSALRERLQCTASEMGTTFIDRFLASAEAYRVPVVLALNKDDELQSEDERATRDYWVALYSEIGYPCHVISAITGKGLDELGEALQGKTTLLAGNSGVGKSTLLNHFIFSCFSRPRNPDRRG